MATAAERRAARAKAARENGKHTEKAIEASADNEPAAPEVAEEANKKTVDHSRSRDVVTVGCKVPNGLILQLDELIDGFEQVFGGGSRPIKVARRVGDQLQINGPARAPGSDPDAKRVIGGYGLTHNVPKEFIERWLEANKGLDIVKNKLIFINASTDRAADQARDQKMFRSGLEPLNTEGRKADGSYIDPRMPKNVKKYKPEDESTDIRGMA